MAWKSPAWPAWRTAGSMNHRHITWALYGHYSPEALDLGPKSVSCNTAREDAVNPHSSLWRMTAGSRRTRQRPYVPPIFD